MKSAGEEYERLVNLTFDVVGIEDEEEEEEELF